MESARRSRREGPEGGGVPYAIAAVSVGVAAGSGGFVSGVPRGIEGGVPSPGVRGWPGSIPFVSLDRPRANAGPSRIWQCE